MVPEYGGNEGKGDYGLHGRPEYAGRERLPEYGQMKSDYAGRDLLDYPVDPRKQERYLKQSRQDINLNEGTLAFDLSYLITSID